ncbi:MAG: phosphodiester glycosidase family protein [Oscillibacter sp.]|nr:phosphodiester glycosidase family protein [Oscillibacter sp.]
MKRLFRLVAVLTLCALCLAPASGAGSDSDSVARADKLYSLHLFRGAGVNDDGSPVYNLDKVPTRLQGLIMMIRFLGEEEAALACQEDSPFTDVSGEAESYVSYAYRRGVTNGTTESTFTPGATLSVNAYLAFLLRAMGYTEDGGDYAWENIVPFAVSLGILSAEEGASMEADGLDRGGMVDLSYRALTCPVKGGEATLAQVLLEKGVFTAQEARNAGILPGADAAFSVGLSALPSMPWEDAPDESAIDYAKKSVRTSEGLVTAHVLTVNTKNPKVRVKTAMVDNQLGHTASFTKIVQNSGGAVAVVNGNFFNSYGNFQTPIGHVMSNGEFLYGNSGLSSIGFAPDGTIYVGRPAVFTRLVSGEDEWSAYEINTPEQDDNASVLYTPAYGEQVVMKNGGWALTANQGVITEFYSVSAGAAIQIPAGGYVVYMGGGYSSTPYFHIPQKGALISTEYYLRVEDEEGFALDNVREIVSGAPRLVKDGEIVEDLEPGFTEARFTTASSSRTAVGVNGDGELLLISVPAGATVRQMRELALELGCEDAFNLDGGASSAMYYKGNYLTVPGRELTVTLQVFVDE